MNFCEHNGLLNAHRIEPKIRNVVFNRGYPIDYIDNGVASVAIAEHISNYPASDQRRSIRAAAIYCALPHDNLLFRELMDDDELAVGFINDLDCFEDAVKSLERYCSKLIAVVKCFDGVVLFGRGKYENT